MKTKNVKGKITKSLIAGLIAILPLSFISCENDDNDNQINIEGIYIVNEGKLNSNNGSITLFNPDEQKTVQNYFSNNNDWSLGDVVQDLAFYEDKGFIVVNNSQKVEIVKKETFESIGVIEGLSYPRQFLGINDNKGYITNGSSATGANGNVLVIDMSDYAVIDTIEVGKGPESMVKLEDKVYVTNGGGWSVDNSISVIDIAKDTVTEMIKVKDVPMDIAKDANDNLWVFCKGLNSFQGGPTNSHLVKINTSDNSTTDYDIGKVTSYGNYLLATGPDNESIYYTGVDGIYKMEISANTIPETPFIETIPYGLDVNPENGNIYCMVSGESSGYAIRYDNESNLIDSTKVGISPNAAVFE
jgi:YVTN family beta-propeller protein